MNCVCVCWGGCFLTDGTLSRMKKQLFELINEQLKEPRERYNQLMESPAEVEQLLIKGARKAREYSAPLLAKVRQSVGIRPLG